LHPDDFRNLIREVEMYYVTALHAIEQPDGDWLIIIYYNTEYNEENALQYIDNEFTAWLDDVYIRKCFKANKYEPSYQKSENYTIDEYSRPYTDPKRFRGSDRDSGEQSSGESRQSTVGVQSERGVAKVRKNDRRSMERKRAVEAYKARKREELQGILSYLGT
jgi:hypothetical protein